MDIIFHRNCLDGAFSSYILYLLAKVIEPEEFESFVIKVIEKREKEGYYLKMPT